MNRFLPSFVFLFSFSLALIAQVTDDDPFKKMNEKYENKLHKMNSDYEKTTQRMQQEYDDKLKKMNEAFIKYLKGGFNEVEQKKQIEKPVEVPKPVDQPVFETETESKKAPEPIAPKIALIEAPAYSISPIIRKPEAADNYKQPIIVDFFGSKVNLTIDRRSSDLHLTEVTPKAFAQYWGDFSNTYYQLYIESLLNYMEQTNLNDWGIYQVIDHTAKQLYTSGNNREMWKWAMLNQTGYQAKIGYNGNKVCLMLPFMQQVFEKPYYSIEGYNYYLMNDILGNKSIYTYSENFGGAVKKLDLNLPYSLHFNNTDNVITKTTKLPNSETLVQIPMNKTTLDFLSSYPQTDNIVYLNAAMSASVKNALYESIQPVIRGMSETEAVTYLLNYLHHSFEYKTDRDQFGKEKMFFPEEIFYYPYSDCEDRTVLFTRLVNDLLDMDAIALTYFSHMAAAVSFSTPVDGYNFTVSGQNYTICDPTYINAPIGVVMPEYRDYTPLAIKINTNKSMGNIWQSIGKTIEQNNQDNIYISERKLSENGKYIVSGWFKNSITIGDFSYSAYANTRDLWFATFSEGGDLEWFVPVSCSGFAYTKAFNVGKNGNVYALVNYTGSMAIQNTMLGQTENASHIILGLSNKAQPVLAENITFEVPEGKKLAFYGKYKPDGTKVDLLSFPTDKIVFDSDITIDSKNEVVVRGIVGEIEGLTKDVPINLSNATYSPDDDLQENINTLKQQSINQHMISLFAAFNVLSKNGGHMSGLDFRNLIRKNNPEFRKTNPDIYEGLLRLQFVVNKGGVIQIETYKNREVDLLSMQISNNTNLQLIKLSPDNYKLVFLNGAKMRLSNLWHHLNFMTLNQNGTILFDYDNDHSQRKVNLNDLIM